MFCNFSFLYAATANEVLYSSGATLVSVGSLTVSISMPFPLSDFTMLPSRRLQTVAYANGSKTITPDTESSARLLNHSRRKQTLCEALLHGLNDIGRACSYCRHVAESGLSSHTLKLNRLTWASIPKELGSASKKCAISHVLSFYGHKTLETQYTLLRQTSKWSANKCFQWPFLVAITYR